MWNDPAWAFGVAFIILAISLRKALPRLLHSIADRHSGPAQVEAGITVEEVEDLRRRVGELEERVDFAERLLTEQREAAKLPQPGS
jgi:hypothetical protein